MERFAFDWCFDIGLNDWPKRRRAMIYLLENPMCPSYQNSYIKDLATWLIGLLNTNGHPKCAYMIELQLSGVRTVMIDGEVFRKPTLEDLDGPFG